MSAPDTAWQVHSSSQFVDRRSALYREGYDRQGSPNYRYITRNVRAWHAVVVRRFNGKVEYDRCPHAHSKPSSARKCAEAAARRMNRTTQPEGATP